MGRIALMFAMILLPALSMAMTPDAVQTNTPVSKELKQQLLGTPVYIQIFKQERVLELYGKVGSQYRLLDTYRICNFSGGLGPKRREGDFKSPEGFYSVKLNQLKPDSHYYRAINVGFPNQYDRDHNYSGAYLMIHGDCKSIGCYAMTNAYMDEIFTYVNAALRNGQPEVNIAIYPFHMTDSNMRNHRDSTYISFWRELQPGYAWFEKYHVPPNVAVSSGQYVMNNSPVIVDPAAASKSFLALSKTE
ncbi:peptidoglycan meso-diaminopimelic acid protein amidase [Candidatus Pantoea multigeneris]|uniref:Murein L,D-transpeptidase n=1 Tax=Candidatus Pantoea multigeneris TaxID=2608357 RepID=A0ABX0RFR5_9GAMM|nr:peptidoglycan meso-diaminopimelic acid protein amidase [Pantoea multigeneris]NIF23503.1 murein L,D-transpeptidase [Pantoea multigeneris]